MRNGNDKRREGDTRAFIHDPLVHLKWWPARGFPFRWLPRYGDPECVGELITQTVWRYRILLYIAVVVTLSLLVQLFDISFTGN